MLENEKIKEIISFGNLWKMFVKQNEIFPCRSFCKCNVSVSITNCQIDDTLLDIGWKNTVTKIKLETFEKRIYFEAGNI